MPYRESSMSSMVSMLDDLDAYETRHAVREQFNHWLNGTAPEGSVNRFNCLPDRLRDIMISEAGARIMSGVGGSIV